MFSNNMESIVSINNFSFIHASHAAAAQYIKLDGALGRDRLYLLRQLLTQCPNS